MRLENGVTVEVVYPSLGPAPEIVYPSTVTVTPVFVPLQGPQGEASTVPGPKGNIQHKGHGAPGVIVGAQPGDTYLDMDTGTIWELT